MKLTKDTLRIGVRGKDPAIHGELWRPVDELESWWEIDTIVFPEGHRWTPPGEKEEKKRARKCVVFTIVPKDRYDIEGFEYLLKSEYREPDT